MFRTAYVVIDMKMRILVPRQFSHPQNCRIHTVL